MTDWMQEIRNALVASMVPVGARSHGSPHNAPSIAPGPQGSFCFRTFGRVYVELRPMGPLTDAEWSAMVRAVQPFDAGCGATIYRPREITKE